MTEITAPPEPDPQPPQRVPPPGACDCHAHVFGEPENYPYMPARPYTPAPGTLSDYLARYRRMHAALGISRGVLVHSNIHGTDNRVTLDALAHLGSGYRGIALVDADATAPALRALAAAGMRGMRLNLEFPARLTLDGVEQMADRLAEVGWHVQVLLDLHHLPEVVDRLVALPVPVVIDHHARWTVGSRADGAAGRTLLRLLGEGRLWVKVSAPYRLSRAWPHYADALPITRALIRANPEQVVWGSDWPHPALDHQMPRDGDLLDQLAAAIDDDATWQRVLADNPARLYGFGPED